MNWLNKFMAGRYGVDPLSVGFFALGCLLTLTGSITGVGALTYLSYIPLGVCVYRALSRNVTRRRAENSKFVTFMNPVFLWSKKKMSMLADSSHKYIKCPYCKAQLRLPKGKGKISVTCPVCKKEFVRKT